MQLEETVEVVTTDVLEKDRPSSPLAQSPPAESSAGPSVPASREVKNRSKNSKTSLKQLEGKLFVWLCSCTEVLLEHFEKKGSLIPLITLSLKK